MRGGEKMRCGIKVKCNKRFGQWMITGKPYAIINDDEKIEMKWKKELLIPLQPDVPHKISIQFPYMTRTVGTVTFNTQVKPDEIQVYEYKTPHVMTSGGSITRKS